MSRVNLPTFDKPPIVETVLGIQFEPLPGFTNNHLGAFWERLGGKEAWPVSVDAPALRPEFENFGEEQQWTQADAITFGLSSVPASRMQLRNETGDGMVQLQNGRLLYNWLGTSGAEYARYVVIRSKFDDLVAEFRAFLVDEGLPTMRLNQWEVTYVNHLPKETVWSKPEDWSAVFTFQATPPAEVNACRLESVAETWMFEITPRRGRLRTQLQHARTKDGVEVLRFELTARGPIGEGEGGLQSYEAGIDLGHEVIVKSFADLTSAEVRKYWEEQ